MRYATGRDVDHRTGYPVFHADISPGFTALQKRLFNAALLSGSILTFIALQFCSIALSNRMFGRIDAGIVVLLSAPLCAAATAAISIKLRRVFMPRPIELLYRRYDMPLPRPKLMTALRRRRAIGFRD